MRAAVILMLAIIFIANIEIINAAPVDIRKSDFIVNTNSKDLSVATISISVEWESNTSITSQEKTNVKSMTEMALIESVKNYNIAELQANTPSIQENVLRYLRNNSQDPNIAINGVAITKIVSKDELDANRIECQPQIVNVPYTSIWTIAAIIAAFLIGMYVGSKLTGKSAKEEEKDE